ncbi:protein lifeguard 1 [Drosophila grimshawi]|uniref:protein lifeguard 1 n=1 Tax=Drosophila grimshawi TaxID=7222 RepID=UPI001C935148|nr:protein lifeguard 1 [Drosophila grimshawi]
MAAKEDKAQNPQYVVLHANKQPRTTIFYGAADVEGQENNNFLFHCQSIRHSFIRKVYLILMAQLVVTFGIVALFVFSVEAKIFAVLHPGLFWVAVLIMLLTMFAMVCCENVRRETPINFICLGLFTVAESFLMGISASRFAPIEILLAIGITAAICLALTLFALQTKFDVTMMGGILIACLVALLVFGIVSIFMPGRTIRLIYSSLAAVLFSVYLIYDTQLMMGGGHKYSISPEEYIFAALNLYLDIINIFMEILGILSITHE